MADVGDPSYLRTAPPLLATRRSRAFERKVKMSVLMCLRIEGDATQLEHMYAQDPDVFRKVSAVGKAAGATYHRFYATDNEILVIDEWPDEETFHRFFESQTEIPKFMAQAGVTTPPVITCYRKLELGDDIG
jgi:hypothetical protein